MHRFSSVLQILLFGLALLLAACSNQTPEAAPAPLPTEFPNEEGVLISPEGQQIIDAVLEGRLEAPDLNIEVPEFDEGLSTQGSVPWGIRHAYWSSMGHFWWHRARRSPSYANWSTNYCSWSFDKTPYYNFKKPCARHDFGYRNWKKYRAFTKSAKSSIDKRFLRDMKDHCAARSSTRVRCYYAAYTYYGFVK